ncbi:2-oxoglutarate and iron-dependent oxygenase JMJD4 isoform X1 [Protopterus annectens]|uniref:2-oxoglutarate and iron-dependent oxygenase JMJD4 isoform X1 n=2 Tax=Protopterus annectens TaxID=7888 RepID=UPI001CFB5DB4|nr:2-oxoglutarate and iron-dependent oxygenase JMJD4 isoform X1 [Protopterus annectens]
MMDKETLVISCKFYKSGSCTRPSYSKFCRTGQEEPVCIDYITHTDFSYSEFVQNYLLPNYPCILSPSFTEGWLSRCQWVTKDGSPDLEALAQRFREAIVPVANCDIKQYNANPKEHIPLKKYISYWKDYSQSECTSPRDCLYLKDWHMHRAFPDHGLYATPIFFSSDWLNEYWDSIEVDDYRFVYMGPKGSWTPFHADVFHSYSWSANICGRKKWLLFPPGQEDFLRDCHGNLVYDVTATSLQNHEQYPHYSKCCFPIEVNQEAGEIIFIPSGWHHQVYNLEDTISINHNWLNGYNVAFMWNFLQKELRLVQQEISEWKETMDNWHDHCQVIMKSCSGIDYKELYYFLKTVAENRIHFLEGTSEDLSSSVRAVPPSLSILGPWQAVFDLNRVADVLSSLIENEEFKQLDIEEFCPQPTCLLESIKEAKDAVL